jgi:hypothetical protein
VPSVREKSLTGIDRIFRIKPVFSYLVQPVYPC